MQSTNQDVQPLLPRTFVLVDLENLCGGSEWVPQFHGLARKALADHVQPAWPTLTVVAHGIVVRRLFPSLPFEWPEARFLVGAGPDGADHELLDVLNREPAALRSAAVVVASGDGIFADAVAEMVGHGIGVTVLGRPGSVSARLRIAATATVELPSLAVVSDLTRQEMVA